MSRFPAEQQIDSTGSYPGFVCLCMQAMPSISCSEGINCFQHACPVVPESVPLSVQCEHRLAHRASPFPDQHGFAWRAGKSIMQMHHDRGRSLALVQWWFNAEGNSEACILLVSDFDKSSGLIAARCYASAAYVVMRCPFVCPSVCVSVTFVNSVKTNKLIFCSPKGSQVILVFKHLTLL